MNIAIMGKGFSVTDSIREHIESKISLLEKFIHPKDGQEILAEVQVGLRSRHHKKGDIYRAEVNISFDGELYRAVDKKADLFDAIDTIRLQVERQLRRGKRKKISLSRRSAQSAKAFLQRLRN